MEVRILHCGISQENYHICATEKIIGFTKNVVSSNDLIYLVVNSNKETLCGVRGRVGLPSNSRPWEYSEEYPYVFELDSVEYCIPFKVNVMSAVGGRYWHLKYMQNSKAIKDRDAIELLGNIFKQSVTKGYQPLEK